MSIRISLVFPLTEERGQTAEALAAWTKQTYPGERFEIVVVADDAVAIDPQLTALLRPHDRVVRGSLRGIAKQFDAGLRAGQGELLFFTEAHCLPEPDCLDAMDRFLTAHPKYVGACCESVPVWENAYQRIDATTFEEGFRHFVGTGDWRKFSVHGMALRRDIYLELGGLQHEYGRFSEMILAAAIRDAGHKLGYARDSIVHHHYRETLQELIEGTEEYVRDECLYRAANPGPDRIGHTYLPDIPNPFSAGAAELDRELAVALLGNAFPNTAAQREGLCAAGGVLARFLGRRGPVLAARLSLMSCRLRCWWNRNDAARLDAHYRELVRRASEHALVHSLASRSVVDPPLPEPADRLAIARLPGWALRGFHGVEQFNGAAFRWTTGLAALRLPLARGEYRLRLITHGLRRAGSNLRVAINGTRIVPTELPNGDHEIPIERSHCHPMEQILILVCDPLRPWQQGVPDYRELGLPLFAIEAAPSHQAETPGRRAA